MRLIRDRFPSLSVVARNGVIKLMGDDEVAVAEADRVLRRLLRRIRRRERLTPREIEDALEQEFAAPDEAPATALLGPGSQAGPPGGAAGSSPAGGALGGPAGLLGLGSDVPAPIPLPGAQGAQGRPTPPIPIRATGFRPRTPGQKRYIDLIDENDIVFAIGPAGTGKTFLAVLKAVEALKDGSIGRIVLCRPAVEAGEKLGFLPGDLAAKVNPYLRPLYDSLHDLLDTEVVRKLIEREVIEIVPLAYMRGRTLNRSFIILDEAQNTTSAQMKMFLTRMGEGSRIVVTGDETQVDLEPGKLSGLKHIQRILPSIDGIAFHRMTKDDIVRHPLVWQIVQAYERAEGTSGGGEGAAPGGRGERGRHRGGASG